MKNAEKYFSLVSDRIAELQAELKTAQEMQAKTNDSKRIERYRLEAEFIENKINYLNRLINLPILLLIFNLTEEQKAELRKEHNIPEGEEVSYLIKVLGLEDVNTLVNQHKIVTVSHIKDAFIGDFDAMAELLSMYDKNIELGNKKEKLNGIGLTKELSYLRLLHDERTVNRDSEKLEKMISQVEEDFDLSTINEVSDLVFQKNQKLSIEFIEKHSKKVLKENPNLDKVVKRLSRKKYFGWLDRFLPKKRSKDENAFMEAIESYYKHHSAADELGVPSYDLFEMTEQQLASFTEQLQKRCIIRKNQISARRNHINVSKRAITKQIFDIQDKQDHLKKDFIALIRTKISWLPRTFQDQIWSEPDLKQSCMNEACFLEEKQLIAELTRRINGEETTIVAQKAVEIEHPKVKSLVA